MWSTRRAFFFLKRFAAEYWARESLGRDMEVQHLWVKGETMRYYQHLFDPKDTPAAVCYFCGAEITPDDRVRQFHELMVHQTCYQRDVSR